MLPVVVVTGWALVTWIQLLKLVAVVEQPVATVENVNDDPVDPPAGAPNVDEPRV
jgi:hypothetical protein